MFRFWWIVFLLAMLAPHSGQATEVIVQAQAKVFNGDHQRARQQALLNARQEAIRVRLAAFLSHADLYRHRSGLQVHIRNRQKLLVTQQQILEESLIKDSWHVRTRTQVSDSQIAELIRALGISQPNFLGRSIITICLSENSRKESTKEARQVAQTLDRVFSLTGAKIAQNKIVSPLKSEISLAEAHLRLLAIARQSNAKWVLLCKPSISSSPHQDGLATHNQGLLELRLIQTVNSNLLAHTTSSVSLLRFPKTNPSPNWRSELIVLAANRSADEIIKQLRLGNKKRRLHNLLLRFDGFDDPDENKILTWLLSKKSLGSITVQKMKGSQSLQLQLISSLNSNQVRRSIDIGLRKQGLLPRLHPLVGNRILFSNARNNK